MSSGLCRPCMGLGEAAWPVRCSPSAAPRSAARQPSLPSLGSAALLAAQHVSAAAVALPEADEQVVLWFNQFPGEREEVGREEGGRNEKRKDHEYGKIWDNGKART